MLSPTRHHNDLHRQDPPCEVKLQPLHGQVKGTQSPSQTSKSGSPRRTSPGKPINVELIQFDLIETEAASLDGQDEQYLREGVAKMRETLRKPCYPLSAFCLYSMERRDVLKEEGMSSLKIPERIKKDWKTLKTKAFYKELARKHYRCYKLLLRLWDAAQNPSLAEKPKVPSPPKEEILQKKQVPSPKSTSPKADLKEFVSTGSTSDGAPTNLGPQAQSSQDLQPRRVPFDLQASLQPQQANTSSPPTGLLRLPNITQLLGVMPNDQHVQEQNNSRQLPSSHRSALPLLYGIEGRSHGQGPAGLFDSSPAVPTQQAPPIFDQAARKIQTGILPMVRGSHPSGVRPGVPLGQQAKKSFTDSPLPASILQLLSSSAARNSPLQAKPTSLQENLLPPYREPFRQDTSHITLPLPARPSNPHRPVHFHTLLAAATGLQLGAKRGLSETELPGGYLEKRRRLG